MSIQTEAQAYHLLRAATVVGELTSYSASTLRIPNAGAVRTSQAHLSTGNAGQAFMRELEDINRLIGSMGKLNDQRNGFWHPEKRGLTAEQGRQLWEERVANVTDENLSVYRTRVAEAIQRMEGLQHGGRALSAKERDKLGISGCIEALRTLDSELGHVQEMRNPAVAQERLVDSAARYRTSADLAAAPERNGPTTIRNSWAHPCDGRTGQSARPIEAGTSYQTHRTDIIAHLSQVHGGQGNGSHVNGSPAHPPRPIRVSGGVAAAGIVAGTTLLVTGSPAQAAQAGISSVPGVGGLFANNPHEASVRNRVDGFGVTVGAIGAVAGGVAGTPIPVAGNAGGAAVGGLIVNALGSMAADEVIRVYERYFNGKRDTVEPSAGEQAVMGLIQAGRVSLEQLRPYMERAMQTIRERQSVTSRGPARSKEFSSVSDDEGPLLPEDFVRHMLELEQQQQQPHAPESQVNPFGAEPLQQGSPALPLTQGETVLAFAAEALPDYSMNFNMGPLVSMDKYAGQLQEGQRIPEDLQIAIATNGRDFINSMASRNPPVDLASIQEFVTAMGPNGRPDPAKVGAILFAVSLESGAEGLQFDNHATRADLGKINLQPERILAIAENVARGVFSSTPHAVPLQEASRVQSITEDIQIPTTGRLVRTPQAGI
jgi:hypothetical protein